MPVLDTELERALKAMELGFHVRLIGTFDPDLICAPADAQAMPWLDQNHREFDQFPVREGDATIGILPRRDDHGTKSIRAAMDALSERVIVSADMPIADLIPQLRENHYRLILRGGRLDGLVTQSDLLRLPVRMMLFGLISHLEMCLRTLVRARRPWPEWLELLESKRRKEVKNERKKLRDARFEPDPLEFSNLSDVVNVLAQEPDLGDDFRTQAAPIIALRNDIAHAKTYIASPDDVQQFVDRFADIRNLIDRVQKAIQQPSTTRA